MKIFRHWVEESRRITIGGQAQEITLLVGSNVSKDAAKREATARAETIERRIANGGRKEEYEVGVSEYVSDVINGSNMVTVCRYGAKVLNTDQYTVLDLDDYAKSIWDVFRSLKSMTTKERIVFKFEQFVGKNPEIGSDFRIYETAKGIRVIGKQYLDPVDRKNIRLMRRLNVDWLYVLLSRKQQCYRARLTPKPHRLKIRTIKVKTPLVAESDHYKDWSKTYEEAAQNYSVAKYLKSLGHDFSYDQVVRYHDDQCKAHESFTLA